MKKLMTMLALAALCGCTDKLETISGQVLGEMQTKLVEKGCYRNLKLDKVTLINVEGNKYTGTATGRIADHEIKFDVDCIADGTNVKWDAKLAEGNDLAFLAKEGAASICSDAADVAADLCDGAVSAASNLCDSAKSAASDLCDDAKAAWDSGKAAATEKLKDAGAQLGGAVSEILDNVKTKVGDALNGDGTASESPAATVETEAK